MVQLWFKLKVHGFYKHSHHLHFWAPFFASFFSKTRPRLPTFGCIPSNTVPRQPRPVEFFTDFADFMVMKSDDVHGIFHGFFHVFFKMVFYGIVYRALTRFQRDLTLNGI